MTADQDPHKIPTPHTPHRTLPAPRGSSRSNTYPLVEPDEQAPAIGLEPIACRLTEGLSWPGAPEAVSNVTLSCLQKGVPGLTRRSQPEGQPKPAIAIGSTRHRDCFREATWAVSSLRAGRPGDVRRRPRPGHGKRTCCCAVTTTASRVAHWPRRTPLCARSPGCHGGGRPRSSAAAATDPAGRLPTRTTGRRSPR